MVGNCDRRNVSSRSWGSVCSTMRMVSLRAGIQSRFGLSTRQHPPKQHAGGKDGDAQHLAGRRLAVEVTGRVIAAKNFHERPEYSVENEVRGKDLAVESFPAIQPGQRSVEPKVQDRFVNLCRMNTRAVR